MGKVYVIGLGPGNESYLTAAARAALDQADVICGYTVYVRQVAPLYPQKETFTTGMRGEIERCRWALDQARQGRCVALVCSGDAGVYGMASPVLELAPEYLGAEVTVVAGVTAALSGSALLGAPLSHDFCVISLSDLLTPWEMIEKRLAAAAGADLCLCIYNPASQHRPDYLQKACDILLRHKSGDTLCGAVRNIGREGQSCTICTLSELRGLAVDMFTTVFIGSSQTRRIGDYMVTPRGYSL